ncbi:uncharacterized protein N7477_000243 [Penicillium maclennaniae]|uniref:uncharacterized protein n=1 Tax=Penicillium maclennaniae TaxID=1343394 RepID=UPI00253F6A36|nr:uncharacterized protein N7477_000243 [Penicillium maclennaniae]KAJ5683898.1 hypothetical protein N7477_000243 [Penicillium maclennaniae]
MSSSQSSIHIPAVPDVLDSVRLRDIELPLPAAPDAWHRPDKAQPCIASLKLSYSSAIASAAQDEVSLSLDYGKLFRRLEADIRNMAQISRMQREDMKVSAVGQDPRVTAGIVANCGLGLLEDTAAGVRRMEHVQQSQWNSYSGVGELPSKAIYALDSEYGTCEVWLHLPKALLRAEDGLKYRSVTAWGYKKTPGDGEALDVSSRAPVVLEEEFRIEGIRSYCILGVNPHERVEKQAVIISLTFEGPGQHAWGSTFLDTYQAMTRAVAEKVDETTFLSVEALATFVARIVTMDFGNERVTVRVEKPSALAFVQRSGVEITRSQAFFQKNEVAR